MCRGAPARNFVTTAYLTPVNSTTECAPAAQSQMRGFQTLSFRLLAQSSLVRFRNSRLLGSVSVLEAKSRAFLLLLLPVCQQALPGIAAVVTLPLTLYMRHTACLHAAFIRPSAHRPQECACTQSCRMPQLRELTQ